MKKIVSIIIAFLLCAPFAVAQQQEPESKPNIAETIQQESAGQIIIDIPEELQKELLEEPAVKSAPKPGASANRGNRGQSSAKSPEKSLLRALESRFLATDATKPPSKAVPVQGQMPYAPVSLSIEARCIVSPRHPTGIHAWATSRREKRPIAL